MLDQSLESASRDRCRPGRHAGTLAQRGENLWNRTTLVAQIATIDDLRRAAGGNGAGIDDDAAALERPAAAAEGDDIRRPDVRAIRDVRPEPRRRGRADRIDDPG